MLDKPVIITAGTNAEPTKNSISFEAMGANNNAPKAPDTAKAKPIKEYAARIFERSSFRESRSEAEKEMNEEYYGHI